MRKEFFVNVSRVLRLLCFAIFARKHVKSLIYLSNYVHYKAFIRLVNSIIARVL